MRVTASCHCAAIAYEAEIDPLRVGICHCADCQKLTGSAYRVSVAAARATFRLLRGEPKIYVKRGDSGARRAQAFCADCGSPLYTFDADRDDDYGLRVGCIDQRRALVPRRQIWCGSALDWAFDIGSLPRRDAE
ncbi:MAG TPA: GFA family protein [Burkholderiaceae bacterium]|jgi:hypothetical protein|nr:GFA family protein [Burkholderiaceae bacterium]